MAFAERFRELRNKRGWTQDDAAERLGVTRVSISKYESGTIPGPELLVKVADLFNVTVDYLLGRVDESNKYFFNNDKLSDDDNKKLKKFIQDTEALLRDTGEIEENKLDHVMQFMEFVFRRDIEEQKKKK